MGKWSKHSMRLAVAAALAAMLITAGCGQDTAKKDTPSAQGYPVVWSESFDGNDKVEFKVTEPPTHAVSMSQATTEMMLALGLEKNMVGTAFLEEEVYAPLQGAYDKVPVLAEQWPSYEVFMTAKPDFATGWPTAFSKRGIEASKLTPNGVRIWLPESMLSTQADLEMNFQDMLMLGKIFNVSDKAEMWVADQRKQLELVEGKIKDLPRKRVFIYDSEDGEPFTAFEGYTTNILRLIGADNVMSGLGVDKTWGKGSWETVVEQNPDYIIIADYGNSIRNDDDFRAKVEKLRTNPQLQSIKAIQEGNFIRVKLSEITPGVRTVDALTRLAEEIHGIELK
ncbi:MAG: ABC transporter substrate-binding protein [Veillonellaceae bacterium]|nr:ABC transporter substrate-binding protein [Veillonellaceae bacterium]